MATLGVDFGLRKIGLAYADFNLAEPLAVLKNDEKVFEKIGRICKERQIGEIVVGKPEGLIGKKSAAFGRKLTNFLGIPVIFQAEILTTKEATDKMISAGRGRNWRRTQEDAVAAALLLHEYFEKLK